MIQTLYYLLIFFLVNSFPGATGCLNEPGFYQNTCWVSNSETYEAVVWFHLYNGEVTIVVEPQEE